MTTAALGGGDAGHTADALLGGSIPHALVVEIIFQFLTPVNAARIDYIAEKVRRDGIYPDIKYIVALYVFFTGNGKHVFHKTDFVFQYVFFPNVVGQCGYVEAGDLTVATAGDPRMSVQLEDKVSSTNVAYVAQVR